MLFQMVHEFFDYVEKNFLVAMITKNANVSIKSGYHELFPRKINSIRSKEQLPPNFRPLDLFEVFLLQEP